jgi:CRP-like cAMP-binding protein
MLDLAKLGLFTTRRDATRPARLRQLGPFSALTRRERRVVESLLHERHYLKGEVIFDQGEEGQALYIVVEGRVLICHQGQPEAGKIAELEAGTVFGELALLDGAPRAAQARAADDCLLASLSRDDFDSLLQTHAVISSKIALQLARQLGAQLRDRRLPLAQYAL